MYLRSTFGRNTCISCFYSFPHCYCVGLCGCALGVFCTRVCAFGAAQSTTAPYPFLSQYMRISKRCEISYSIYFRIGQVLLLHVYFILLQMKYDFNNYRVINIATVLKIYASSYIRSTFTNSNSEFFSNNFFSNNFPRCQLNLVAL